MEYLPLGDLHKYLKDLQGPLPETEAKQIVFQLLEALKFMHDNNFTHRDLKPAVCSARCMLELNHAKTLSLEHINQMQRP